MDHSIKNLTDSDLLAVIMSPHTTPDHKRSALAERTRRRNKAPVLRPEIPYNYKAYNGVILSNSAVDSYNRIQNHINKFIESGLPVPDYLTNSSHNIFMSAINT